MSPDVRTLLHDAAATPATPPDVGAAVRAGRRLRHRRNAARAAAGGLAAALVVGIASVAAPPRGRDAAPATSPAFTLGEASAFAGRAAVEAWLASGGTREYEPRFPTRSGDEWFVGMARTPCTALRASCVGVLRIAADGDAMVVREAVGDWPAAELDALVGFRAIPRADAEMIFRMTEVEHVEGAARLVARSAWTGPIPSRGYSVDCVVKAYDASGALVESRAIDVSVPQDEAERAGGFVAVPVPAETASATIDCATLRAEDAAP
jgi:hypothetical protein